MSKNTASKTPGKHQVNTGKTPGSSIWSVMAELQDNLQDNILIDIERLSPASFNGIPIRGLVSQLGAAIDLDEFRKNYGGGHYKVTIRKNGSYFMSERFSIPGIPVLEEQESGMAGTANIINQRQAPGSTRKDILEEMVMMQKITGGGGNGNNSFLEKLSLQLLNDKKGSNGNGLEGNLESMTKLLTFTEAFAKRIGGGDYEPTLEGEIARNLPDLIELLGKAKTKTLGLKKRTGGKDTYEEESEAVTMPNDFEYLIFKMCEYIDKKEDPERASDLAFDILNEKQITMLAGVTYDDIMKQLKGRLTEKMLQTYTSEAGKKFIIKVLSLIKKECTDEPDKEPSRPVKKVSPKRLKKSGGKSGKGGRGRSSASKQKK